MLDPTRDVAAGSTSLALTDRLINADASGGAVELVLPDTNGKPGIIIVIKEYAGGEDGITVSVDGGGLIDGASSLSMPAPQQCVWLRSVGDGNFRSLTGSGGGVTFGRDMDYIELGSDTAVTAGWDNVSGMNISLDLQVGGKVKIGLSGKVVRGFGLASAGLGVRIVGPGGTDDYDSIAEAAENQGSGGDTIYEYNLASAKGIFLPVGSYTFTLRAYGSPATCSLLEGALLAIDYPTRSSGGGSSLDPEMGGDVTNPASDAIVQGIQGDLLPSPVAGKFWKRNAGGTAWELVGYGTAANSVAEGNHVHAESGVTGLVADLAALVAADAAGLATEALDLRKDGSRALTGNLSMGSHKLTSLSDGTAANDAVNLSQLTAAVDGLSWKEAVRAASTANVVLASLIAGFTVDGVVCVTGDRILLKSQTDAKENGIYVVQLVAVPVRSTDADSTAELDDAAVLVRLGTTNANTAWVQTTDDPTIGVSNIVWAQRESSVISAGDGLTRSGTTINVGAGDGIQADADSVTVKLDGTTLSKSGSGLKVNAIPESAVTSLTTDLAAKEETANKDAVSGYAGLNASQKVIKDPANATATPTASKIVIADASGLVDGWVSDADATTKGKVKLANALGGTAALPTVIAITETSGPTKLVIGTIGDGEFLKRNGSTLISAAGSVDTDEKWGKSWLSGQSLLPDTSLRNEGDNFPAADLSFTSNCTVTRLRSRMKFAASANFGSANQTWDITALKDKALILLGALLPKSYDGGVYLMKTLTAGNQMKTGYLFRHEINNNQWNLLRADSESSFTSLGTLAHTNAMAPFSIGFHFNGLTGQLTGLVKFAGEQWWPVIEVTDTTFTQVRYAGVETVSNALDTYAALPLVVRYKA